MKSQSKFFLQLAITICLSFPLIASEFDEGEGRNDKFAICRKGNLFVCSGTDLADRGGRPIKSIISTEEFDKLNERFKKIDECALNTFEYFDQNQMSSIFAKYKNYIVNKENEHFFSICDGEAVYFEGNIRNNVIPYLITTGVHNCVAVTLHARGGGESIFFTITHY